VKLAAEGTLTTNLSRVPLIGSVAAKVDAALVTKAITTSSEHINRYVQTRFKDRGRPDAYHRFSVTRGMDVKLHEYKKIPLIRDATEKYLAQPATRKAIEACAKKLSTLDLPQNIVKKRKSFSEPNDIESVVEASSGLTKELLLKMHQLPSEASVALFLTPESLWPKEWSFEPMSIHDIFLNASEIDPTGELVFKFALKNPQKKLLI